MKKRGIEATRGSLYSLLSVPDSSRPFHEEVDFFDFLIDTVSRKNGEKRTVPDGGLGTDNNAGGAGTGSNGASVNLTSNGDEALAQVMATAVG